MSGWLRSTPRSRVATRDGGVARGQAGAGRPHDAPGHVDLLEGQVVLVGERRVGRGGVREDVVGDLGHHVRLAVDQQVSARPVLDDGEVREHVTVGKLDETRVARLAELPQETSAGLLHEPLDRLRGHAVAEADHEAVVDDLGLSRLQVHRYADPRVVADDVADDRGRVPALVGRRRVVELEQPDRAGDVGLLGVGVGCALAALGRDVRAGQGDLPEVGPARRSPAPADRRSRDPACPRGRRPPAGRRGARRGRRARRAGRTASPSGRGRRRWSCPRGRRRPPGVVT